MLRALSRLPWTGFLFVLLPASRAYAGDCYIDSVAGDDSKSGTSEAEARKDWTSIPSDCTTVKYKRGSVFNLASGDTVYPAKKASGSGSGTGTAGPGGPGGTSKVKVITNYGDASQPLPKFIKKREHNNGGMVSAYQGGLTIDGIYLEGAESDAQMKNLAQGICVMAGSNTKVLNSEITNCDIGLMLSGTGSLVQGNYVHDLHVVVDAPPGVDPNLVGGAEGIFVNASDNEVAYNTFVNCSDYAEWTGGDCDGGATEVTVGSGTGTTVSGVKIHHNFAYNTCGFFEVSSIAQLAAGQADAGAAAKGTFADSSFYNNVIIDSGWLSLLQVNNTNLSNIKWMNNTLVQRKGSTNSGIIAVVYGSGGECSSAMCGGSLQPNTVFWTNNLFVFDGVPKPSADKNFVQTTNIITTTDPGFVDLKGTTPGDFDLVAGSQAIDQGTAAAEVKIDFLNRTVPNPGGKPDVGAFEYDSKQESVPPTFGGAIGSAPSSSGAGGATSTTAPSGAGGKPSGTAPGGGGKGGSAAAGTDPSAKTGGSTQTTGTGGNSPSKTGESGESGQPSGHGGAAKESGSAAGAGNSPGSTSPTAAAGSTGATTGGTRPPSGSNGCSCDLGQRRSLRGAWQGPWLSLLGLAWLAMHRRRIRRAVVP